MMFYNTRDFVTNSQDFTLRLSEDSTIEDTQDFVAMRKTEEDNVIVISDSSCSSSPEHNKSQWKSTVFNIKNKKRAEFTRQNYQRLHVLDTSSESEEEKFNFPWRRLVKSDNKSDKKYVNKSTIQIDKAFCTSDDTTSSSNINNDYVVKDGINNLKKSNITPTLMFAERKMMNTKIKEKYDINETNDAVTPSRTVYNYNFKTCSGDNKSIYNTPDIDSTGKVKLTKKDIHKILSNIKATQLTYNSPREKNETNIIIDESTDIDDIMHPAISPTNYKYLKNLSGSPDVIDTSLKNNILPDSQINLTRTKPYFSEFSDTPKKEDLYKPLSEKKKIQIAEWLMTNSADSQNDSSYSHISQSNRNSTNSGSSSLERLEMNYETPNNRGKFNKDRWQMDEKTIIINSDGDSSDKDSLTHQTALNTLVKKSEDNNSKFYTPDRSKILPKVHTDKKISPVVNIPTNNIDRTDYADILDKVYGKSWRSKADALLPASEPRKTSVYTTNRIVQTERKPIISKKHYVPDSDPDDFNLGENIKSNKGKKIQQKYKKQDSFINDESLSDSDIESEYHTALTNPKTSINSTASKPVSVPASIKRLQAICDTDTEDENDKSTIDSKSNNLLNKRLSFSDDESSDTSEYDPGDYVPPKEIYKKKATMKTLQPSTVKSKIGSITTNKFIGYKSFLTSLSKTVPMSNTHPNAKKYRLDYKNNKEKLCKELYKLYNEKVFDNKLPQDMPIEWNVRMRGTAGYCYNKKSTKSFSGVVKSSRIVLATKILDTPDRLRDTLIHEMCHAASWLINDVSDGHGAFWTAWVNKAMKVFPELPAIRRCHDYEIKTKFTYRCTSCGYSIGRHSKSLDIEKKRCGHCYGKFELLINKMTKSGTVQVQTPRKEPSGFALFVKQNYKSVKKEKNNMKHADVMKLLGQQFSAIKIVKSNDDLAFKNRPEPSS